LQRQLPADHTQKPCNSLDATAIPQQLLEKAQLWGAPEALLCWVTDHPLVGSPLLCQGRVLDKWPLVKVAIPQLESKPPRGMRAGTKHAGAWYSYRKEGLAWAHKHTAPSVLEVCRLFLPCMHLQGGVRACPTCCADSG